MATSFAHFVFWHQPDLVHPDDLPRFQHLCKGLCYRCYSIVGSEGEYRLVDISGERFRVKSEAIRALPPSRFVPGQKVRSTTGTVREGWVVDVGWHHKAQKHTYWIEVEGTTVHRRRVSRRYWEEDLQSVGEGA